MKKLFVYLIHLNLFTALCQEGPQKKFQPLSLECQAAKLLPRFISQLKDSSVLQPEIVKTLHGPIPAKYRTILLQELLKPYAHFKYTLEQAGKLVSNSEQTKLLIADKEYEYQPFCLPINKLWVFNASNGEEIFQCKINSIDNNYTHNIDSLGFSPLSNFVYICCHQSSSQSSSNYCWSKMWDLNKPNENATFFENAQSLQFSEDESQIILGMEDQINIKDTQTKKTLKKFNLPEKATQQRDDYFFIQNAQDPSKFKQLPNKGYSPTLSSDGRFLFSFHLDTLIQYDLETEEQCEYKVFPAIPRKIQLSNNTDRIKIEGSCEEYIFDTNAKKIINGPFLPIRNIKKYTKNLDGVLILETNGTLKTNIINAVNSKQRIKSLKGIIITDESKYESVQYTSSVLKLFDLSNTCIKEWQFNKGYDCMKLSNDGEHIILYNKNCPKRCSSLILPGYKNILCTDQRPCLINIKTGLSCEIQIRSELFSQFNDKKIQFLGNLLIINRSFWQVAITQFPTDIDLAKTSLAEIVAYYIIKNNRSDQRTECSMAKQVVTQSSNQKLKDSIT